MFEAIKIALFIFNVTLFAQARAKTVITQNQQLLECVHQICSPTSLKTVGEIAKKFDFSQRKGDIEIYQNEFFEVLDKTVNQLAFLEQKKDKALVKLISEELPVSDNPQLNLRFTRLINTLAFMDRSSFFDPPESISQNRNLAIYIQTKNIPEIMNVLKQTKFDVSGAHDSEQANFHVRLSPKEYDWLRHAVVTIKNRPYMLRYYAWTLIAPVDQEMAAQAYSEFLKNAGFGSSTGDAVRNFILSLKTRYEYVLKMSGPVALALPGMTFTKMAAALLSSDARIGGATIDNMVAADLQLGLYVDALKGRFGKLFDRSTNEIPDLVSRDNLVASLNSHIRDYSRLIAKPRLQEWPQGMLPGLNYDINGDQARVLNYAYNRMLLPTSTSALSNLESTVEQARKDAINFSHEFLIGHPEADSRVREALVMTQFSLPKTSNDFKGEFENDLQQIVDLARSSAELHANITDKLQQLLVLKAFKLTADFDALTEVTYLLMRMPAPSFLNDHTYAFNGSILLSSVLVNEPRAARYVVLHEIGHVVSGVLSNLRARSTDPTGTYTNVRTCLSYQHPEDTEWVSDNGSDSIKVSSYAEEDWADWFAAKAGAGDVNGACLFGYKKADYRDQMEKNILLLVNPFRGDPHSAKAFRIIQEERLSGRPLPPVCNEVVRNLSPEYNNPVCH